MVEYELIFRIPKSEFEFSRVVELVGTYNATKMRGFAKNMLQVTDYMGSGEINGHIVFTMRVQQRGAKWIPVTKITEELVKSNGKYAFVTKAKHSIWLEMRRSVNWRKVFFRRYGRYQIAGPKL